MSLPIFSPKQELEQVLELKEFLKDAGADGIKAEASEKGWPYDLDEILSHIHICWKETIQDIDVEDILNAVVSLILLLPRDVLHSFVVKICKEYESIPNENIRKSTLKLHTLNSLFLGLPDGSPSKYHVFTSLLECALKLNQINQVITNTDKIHKWLSEWNCSSEERQALWRRLHEIHLQMDNTEKASEAMIKLLTTYTDENAGKAREDAIRCIVTALRDPNVLAMDHLLLLKPVQFLEGEPIHDLLTIFVSGSLSDYVEFTQNHADIIAQGELNNESCLTKMRILTLMKLAETKSELDYNVIQTELHLKEEEIEEFVIEAVRQRAVSCKLDQVQQRVLVSGALPRSFGRAQWESLQEALYTWRSNLQTAESQLEMMVRGSDITGPMGSAPS